ncbi:MAG: hypothetical protein HXS48_07045 [Theionarchaea archaeon]|nr:hypothetical protein [Theionarchaea archaeon]
MAKLPQFCPQTGASKCGLSDQIVKQRIEKQPYVIIMTPYGPEGRYDDTVETIRKVISRKKIHQKGVRAILASEISQVGARYCLICQSCWFSTFGIAELGDLNNNVLFEVGLMYGFGKHVIFTCHRDFIDIRDLPFNISDYFVVPYRSSLSLSLPLEKRVEYILQLLG